MAKRYNLLLIGIDSLRSDHMSLHGYPRLTTPHIDRFAQGGTVFDNAFSAHIPTTPGYSNMLSGMDCFGTNCVALRHQGPLADGVVMLPEILKREGYNTTSVGFEHNPGSRGFDTYLHYQAWGTSEDQALYKADGLNEVALPELERLAKSKKPFFLFLRHMDPHSPYLPPRPYQRLFYGGNERDKKHKTMKAVWDFKPFSDYFSSWLSNEITDAEYVVSLYDGAVAYMDAAIANIFEKLRALDLEDDTLVVIDSDHGETLYDHDCYFDHHGLYEPTLRVPLIFHLPGRVPSGLRLSGNTTLMNVTPTILDILAIKPKLNFDGKSLYPEMKGRRRKPDTEFYITECTWMRKHGWRTPEWKLICALEPDFHFKPEVELYNLIDDPEETKNLAGKEKGVVALLENRMNAWIAKREKQTGRDNPMFTNTHWHGFPGVPGPFESSQQAYDTLHIGDPETARKLQAKSK